MDGYAVIRRLRAISGEQWVPVILLSSLARDEDIARGINAGADDYLIKPIRRILLRAKIQAMQRIIKWHHRRAGVALSPSVWDETAPLVLRREDLTVDLEAHRVTLKGQDIRVSPREWTILVALMRNMGKVVLRVTLEQMLYGEYGEIESNSIDVHIHHLRRKLGPNLIRTVRGVGFMIEHPQR